MRYRKKPIVVEADQFYPDRPLPFSDNGVIRFGCGCGEGECCHLCNRFWVNTLEGPLAVSAGDWIVKGIEGEFYPVKPSVFAATYEPVADPPPEESTPMTEPTKFDVLNRLHDVFTRHGIASRTMNEGLVTDVIAWAADACRQSQPEVGAEAAALVAAVQQIVNTLTMRADKDHQLAHHYYYYNDDKQGAWFGGRTAALREVRDELQAVVARLAGGPPPK